MPRLREVSRAEVTDPVVKYIYQRKYGDRDPVKDPAPIATGAPGNWETVMAQSPDVFVHVMQGFEMWQDPAREIDPLLRELALVRVGWACEAQFVFSQHCKVLRRVGGTEQQVADITNWQNSTAYSPVQRAVLAYADCLALQHGRTPDALFDELKSYLSEPALIELTYFAGTYVLMATITRAFRLEFDDVAERITEVDPPQGFDLAKHVLAERMRLPPRPAKA